MTKVTDSKRILVSCSKDGMTWFLWHKGNGRGKTNQPSRCKFENLASNLYTLAKQVGKIE